MYCRVFIILYRARVNPLVAYPHIVLPENTQGSPNCLRASCQEECCDMNLLPTKKWIPPNIPKKMIIFPTTLT